MPGMMDDDDGTIQEQVDALLSRASSTVHSVSVSVTNYKLTMQQRQIVDRAIMNAALKLKTQIMLAVDPSLVVVNVKLMTTAGSVERDPGNE